MRVVVTESAEEFAQRAAGGVVEVVAGRHRAALGLPSGSTPLGLYAGLARRVREGEADLSGATVFAVDELHGVPGDHPATNASYFRERLARRVPLRACHVMDSSAADAAAECERFARLIEAAGGLDLVVLGIGRNGHIAFNEPGSPFDSRCRLVELTPSTREPYAALFGSPEAAPAHGLTLGIADLLEAPRVLLLASGGDKAAAVTQALERPATEALPASVLQRHPALTVVLDEAAASGLSYSSRA